MKKVCVFTGSRANYSSTKTIIRAISSRNDLVLQNVIGAAGVLDRYGNIEKLMEKDGFRVDAKIYTIVEGENPTTMAKSTGLGIMDLSMVFSNLKPDIVVIVGDRFDVMAPAIAASFMNIPIAHTMGGEVSGTIDESIRHAITKLAHIHFPANEDAKSRIIKMGENPKMVFNVGCPRMDLIKEILESHRNGERINQNDFFNMYRGVGGVFDLQKESFLLVSQHPVTTEYGSNRVNIEETLFALQELKMPTIMIWPNADAGSDEVSKGIRTFRERNNPGWLHLFVNLPIDVFVKLMDLAACMVGNSSSAVREGAYIGVPAVNVGTRQNMRLKGKNIIDVSNNKEEILLGIKKQLHHGKYEADPLYGIGKAGNQIAQILSSVTPNIQKIIHY